MHKEHSSYSFVYFLHVRLNFVRLTLVVFDREVPMKEAKEFAESIAAIFIETSARNAVNVEELFQKISKFSPYFVTFLICMCIFSLKTLLYIESYLFCSCRRICWQK